jgi:hypothetical protein
MAGEPIVESYLETHSSEYGSLVYRSRVDELDAGAAHHHANQPANQPEAPDFQPLSNTQAVSNQRFETGPFFHAQGDFRGPSYEQVLSDAFSNFPLADSVNTPSGGSFSRHTSVEYVQRYNNFNAFERAPAIPVQDLSGQGHLTGRLSSNATVLNPSPFPRQAEQSNEDQAIFAGITNIFQQANDGAQMFFDCLSNTNPPPSHTMRRQTADWEDGINNFGLYPSTTNQPLIQMPDNEMQTYRFYDMGLSQSDHGAHQMEMPATVPDVPFLVYDKPRDDSEDPFTNFPIVDSRTGAADRHNWSNV